MRIMNTMAEGYGQPPFGPNNPMPRGYAPPGYVMGPLDNLMPIAEAEAMQGFTKQPPAGQPAPQFSGGQNNAATGSSTALSQQQPPTLPPQIFSPAQQGIGSIQQAPNTPAMESSPTDYNQSPQYAPTQQYSAPAPMTAGLGSYMQGLRYQAPTATTYNPTDTGVSTNEYIYDPKTQTDRLNPAYVKPVAPAVDTGGVTNTDDGGDGDGGDGDGGDGDGGEKAGGRIRAYARGGSTPQGIASLGRGQDSMLVHMTPGEVQGLQKLAMAHGGSLTINPQTGLPEAGFLSSMLPMLASAAAIALAPATMGASTVALLGAGAGAATGYLTNKRSPLMGAVMGGISGYGMGSIGEGLAQAGTTAELNVAATNTLRNAEIDKLVANYAKAPVDELGGLAGTAMNTDQYRNFLNLPENAATFTPPTSADLTAFRATDAGKKILAQNNMMSGLQGLSSEQGRNAFIGQTAKDSATGKATGLGGGVAATLKGAGLAAPLISSALTPNKFVPPPVKPPTFYNTSYQPPKYNPATGMYDPASYGPGSYYTNPTQYAAQGGTVGYAEGGEARVYPHTGDPIANTGGYGGRGEKPQYSRDIYGDEAGEGPYSDAAGEGPYDDKEGRGVYSNTKPNKSTPAKRVLAAEKATSKARKLRALLQDNDDTDYAAEGGLMGLHTYAAGGRLLRGPGDGMSDSIPAVIKGARPQRAALADGEFVIPADVVSHLGNGSTEAGSKHLYSMMDKVRRARTGNPKQGKQINPARFMPA